MRLAALLTVVAGVLLALRFMIVFLWLARHHHHNATAYAVASSAGGITVYALLILADVVFDLGRWLIHLAAGILLAVMFPVWSSRMDTLVTFSRNSAPRHDPADLN